MKKLLILMVALIMCGGVAMAEEHDELSGAWRTGDDSEIEMVLLLYPGFAFRLHEIDSRENTTQLLEGTRSIEGDSIIVTDIRLGRLDADGNYELIGEAENDEVYSFVLDTEGYEATLTLTDAQERTMILYAFDMSAPE